MFGCLGLRTGFVPGDKQECSVHDGSTVEHGSHENVVSWTVDKGNVSNEFQAVATTRSFARRVVLLVGTI